MRHCPNQLFQICIFVSMFVCIGRKKKSLQTNIHICRFMEKKIKAPSKTVTIVLIDSCTVNWLQHFSFNVYLQRFTFR